MTTRYFVLVAALAVPLATMAQTPKPPVDPYAAPNAKPPDAATRKAIDEKLATLRSSIDDLRHKNIFADVIADVEIYAKAAEWVTRHNEWYGDTAEWTVRVLDDGLRRAEQAASGPTWRTKIGVSVPRAYRSKVDGSVQPYAVTLPAEFGKDPKTQWRLDVVLHGRDSGLTEVKFLNNFREKTAKDQQFVQLDIYGRGNNAYRWAGETDVFEAIESFLATTEIPNSSKLIDSQRVVLRGFSMGGAGTWHLGLHYPSKWAAIGPGAGFTTTHGYAPVSDKLPEYVEKCLHIYDAADYAENAAMVPVVAYAGEKDKQLQAAKNIEARLKPLGIPMTLLVAPNTEHKLTPEYAKKAELEYTKYAGPGKGRPIVWDTERVRFSTWTTKYSRCEWVQVGGLQEHYQKGTVDARLTAKGFALSTQNIRRLTVFVPVKQQNRAEHTIEINGESLVVSGYPVAVELERVAGGWQSLGYQKKRAVEKSNDVQGPIDDAFSDAFLCVRGTGTPWHAATGKHAAAELDRFAKEWDRFMRGTLPIKDDTAVTADDIKTKHLILFGDPASNSLIAKVLPKLPLTWTKDNVTLAGATGSAVNHMPVMIQPNPLNPSKYVVLNSGHTFHADAFRGTNALLFPRLGDFALLKLAPTPTDTLATEIVTAGLFDEFWRLPKK
jgi:predicted esterase